MGRWPGEQAIVTGWNERRRGGRGPNIFKGITQMTCLTSKGSTTSQRCQAGDKCDGQACGEGQSFGAFLAG